MHTHTQEMEALQTKHASEVKALELNAANEADEAKKEAEQQVKAARDQAKELQAEVNRLKQAVDSHQVMAVVSLALVGVVVELWLPASGLCLSA